MYLPGSAPLVRSSRNPLLFALLGLAHWFFGNLYETIVLAPNLLTASLVKLQAWQAYFTLTNQLYYYIPFTQLAVVATWVLWYQNRHTTVGPALRKASWLGLLALLLTAYIVTQLNLRLFFGDVVAVRNQLHTMAIRWNLLNLVRVALVGGALYHVFQAYLSVARPSVQPG